MVTREIALADEVCAIAIVGDVFITVLHLPSTLESMRAIRRVATRHAQVWKGTSRSMTVIEPRAIVANTSEEVRTETAAMTRDFTTAANAVVVEGSGFGVAAVRTLLAGVYLVQRVPYPYKIVSTPAEGVRWLLDKTPQFGATVTSADLIDTIERARIARSAGAR
jgi:hypothetical protein